jgi:hypothetical protein
MARLEPRGALEEALHEGLVDPFVDEELLGRHADLALVHERSEVGGLGRLVEVRVLEHDHRVLAAEFHAALLEVGAALGRDLAAHGGGAGEGDALHARVLDQRVAHLAHALARAGDDVEDAGRDARLLEDLGVVEAARIGGVLGRLQDDCVAGGQRRRIAARGQDAGHVPRRDDAHDAQRPARRHRHLAVGRGQDLADRLVAERGGCAEDVGHEARLEHALPVPAAAFVHDGRYEGILPRVPDVRDAEKRAGALLEGQGGPRREGRLRGLDRAAHVGGGAVGDAGVDGIVGRVQVLEGAGGGHPGAADVHAPDVRGNGRAVEHGSSSSVSGLAVRRAVGAGAGGGVLDLAENGPQAVGAAAEVGHLRGGRPGRRGGERGAGHIGARGAVGGLRAFPRP